VRAEERKREWGRSKYTGRRQTTLILKHIWGRRTGSHGNFVDHGDVNSFGKVFKTITDREFYSAVNVMQIFEPVVLLKGITTGMNNPV